MQHPDQKFIEALLQNNSRLIEEVYSSHFPSVRAMVQVNNGTETDAADLFQDAMIDLHRKAMSGFQLTCPLGGLLYIICKNRWINELKKRKRVILCDEFASAGTHSDEYLEAKESQKKSDDQKCLVQKALARMSSDHCQFLRLAWSGSPLREVAKSMNFSYGYFRKKKTTCMAKLISMVRSSKEFELMIS